MINYVTGDAVHPTVDYYSQVIIVQIVNDAGGYGAGFSGALAKRWPAVETLYREWSKQGALALGKNQYIAVDPGYIVANMCAQHKWKPIVDKPIDYDALEECLTNLDAFCRPLGEQVMIAMPRIGCGLAGGEWSEVESLLNKILPEHYIEVYDLP